MDKLRWKVRDLAAAAGPQIQDMMEAVAMVRME
jgi:hypothetical protein